MHMNGSEIGICFKQKPKQTFPPNLSVLLLFFEMMLCRYLMCWWDWLSPLFPCARDLFTIKVHSQCSPVRTQKSQEFQLFWDFGKDHKHHKHWFFTGLLLLSGNITLGRHTAPLGSGLNLSPRTIPCGRLRTPRECVLIRMTSWGREWEISKLCSHSLPSSQENML